MTALATARPGTIRNVTLVVLWFAVVFLAAATDFFVTEGDEPPWRLGLAAGLPVLLTALGLWLSESFRAWAASLDLHLLIQLQSWRFAGFVFICFSANGLLPASFAIPASIGDVAVALTAPFMANHVARHGRAALPLFLTWTVFGFLDLVNAVTLGVLNSKGPIGVLSDGTLTTDLVTHMPIVLIPVFGVPLMLVLHLLSVANLKSQLHAGH
jgi:hypothetical protein